MNKQNIGIIGLAVMGKNLALIYNKNRTLANLLLDQYFTEISTNYQVDWRKVISTAVMNGEVVPAFSSALFYFDSYRSAELPANLLQARRDYFGAHTYVRTDKPQGEFFHTNWTGHGGKTSSSTYIV